ncbi:class I SAM-dependent methyltransferase [Candidatus Pacearchaeota archaeon]|nr:class I SAM-dependent methyltransferase [Candidatus Pacearchaeota archaeon]
MKEKLESVNGTFIGYNERYCLNIGLKNGSYTSVQRTANPNLLIRADKQTKELTKKIGDEDVEYIDYQLRPILLLLNFDLKNKVILDLGCGSILSCDNRPSADSKAKGRWEPELCRALYKLGAHPIGIDVRGLEREEFEHYEMDLLHDSLSFIKDHSVDLANACAFFDSPALYANAYDSLDEKLREKLFPELKRIIKPEGFLAYSHYI